MTANSYLTNGWTIQQWRDTQSAGSLDDALTRINELVSTFKSYKANDPAWITVASADQLAAQFAFLESLNKSPLDLPLYGVPFAVKDNIDAEGFPTTAACPAFEYNANKDSTVVRFLRQAGAIVVGKTNLDQFATGLVGTRSPYGKTPNTFSDKHVSGGSSSGSASVVARGLVPFALGTDTAGSGRVPASLNNLVGLKPTLGALSTTGVVPACKSLDCVSIFALNLVDAQSIFSIASKFDKSDCYSREFPKSPLTKFGSKPTLAIPSNPQWFNEEKNPVLFEQAVEHFKSLGAKVITVDFSPLYELAQLLYQGPWVGERYDAIREFVTTKPEEMDPIVYRIVKTAENFSAADCFHFEYKRKALLRKIQDIFANIDGLVVPTCPLIPTMDEVAAEPVLVNSHQGTYTNFVNLADLSALAIPAGFRDDGLPFGVTLISEKFNDYALLDLAERFLALSPERTLGATGISVAEGDKLPSSATTSSNVATHIPLAVVGAHLSGMALNWQLHQVKATLAEKTTTSPDYNLFALPTNGGIAKPGLKRVESGGSAIAIEIWNVPIANFGEFMAMVPHPLGIGSVQTLTSDWVKGFICEEIGYQTGASDITEFGGWRNYIASLIKRGKAKPFETILVANRGEIAVRIIRTLKRLGIKTVAVYSEPDRFAQHVLDADVAIDLDGVKASETYLSSDKILAAAIATRAQAIIPGYGFLSENADFADNCCNAGIVFIGPTGDAMRRLGLKHSARQIAEAAQVPLVPGSGLLETLDEALAVAEKLEYPVMLKSTAGGGGIGLQRVNSAEELHSAFDTVRHQGMSYFNDSGVFLERFIENARHVETQIFGDGYGDAIALGERDCSLQRRNQKVIEETPAPKFPDATRQKMRIASEMLVKTMSYKGAGTVEFIYDEKRDEFYFLEVNARLQVEHPITEMVTGLDLVEWMVLIAADAAPDFSQKIQCNGASMEARLYAENPVKGFLPSPGQLTNVSFPDFARVDTWVQKGTTISAEYDPTLAKIIVHGKDRAEALSKMLKALNETSIYGVVTNVDYLRSIVASEMFTTAQVSTAVLNNYEYMPNAIEIQSPGSYTTIQDYPGRIGLWHIGVPPSGPMDNYAFRMANRIVGNHAKAPAMECTLNGPSVLFHNHAVISLTGGNSNATLDDSPIELWTPVVVKPGQILKVGKLTSGCRSYVAIRGGIDVPEYLGSRSTFALGNMGGHNGRVLKFGDVLFLASSEIKSSTIPAPIAKPSPAPASLIPTYGNKWEVAVTSGPHGAPDFFKEESMETFFASEWKVHYNSNRFGVRLVGPKPTWARKDGGEAGLHPSNAHDFVYSIGAINFTGDEPVILTCDGPSLGGFVCAAVVCEADMWKIGQVKPGDQIKFIPVSFDDAIAINNKHNQNIASLTGEVPQTIVTSLGKYEDPVLYYSEESESKPKVIYRQAGDRYVLVEYGENIMDLNLAYRIHRLVETVFSEKTKGVIEMSRGVRSVLIEYDGKLTHQSELLKALIGYEESMELLKDWTIPSRVVKLPMAFEDKLTLNAVTRYQETIRSNAPWLPNNVDFIKEVNGLEDRNEVRDILYSARFLVLGLGDVFLGAPCAVPLDPRHRLLGTKYNPSRTYTPNGTVGLGGMYMCIYTMESPGGYQLVGRTIPIWDKLTLGQQDVPWLLSPFDQIEYYSVTEEELDSYTDAVNNGRFKIEITDETFDYGQYSKWLNENKESIDAFAARQMEGTEEISRLIQISNDELSTSTSNEPLVSADDFNDDAILVYSEVAGRFWKSVVEVGQQVKKGDKLVVLEAMKTEMNIIAPSDGTVIKIIKNDLVEAGDLIVVLE
ncbi:urea amidolyase [Nadsonia fulvescens var. elongata DSM 6958]|uniref:Urea amidolyase n=1 Tax=Nadsonia fulvescens var. elongata DSM 6958 TaxID=857566 RepID=A0A1E3PSD7_9ASCO|nr:urea amidolyase [Nadsonia fulvescens var. elongata DSM 6958]